MNISDLSVHIIQYDIVWQDAEANRKNIENIISRESKSCDIIVLPEAFNSGFAVEAQSIAETIDGKTISWLMDKAEEYGCAICGSLFVNDKNNYYNRFVFASPDRTLQYYDKRHLFSIGGEDKIFSKGENRIIFNYKGWRILPSICYDIRFPVWSRNNLNYDIMINVANWDKSRINVWNTLLKARAIENQCYTIGVNRIGNDGSGSAYNGNSSIIDYKGNPIIELGNNCEVGKAVLSYSSLHSFRSKFNTLADIDNFDIKM